MSEEKKETEELVDELLSYIFTSMNAYPIEIVDTAIETIIGEFFYAKKLDLEDVRDFIRNCWYISEKKKLKKGN